MGEIVINFMGFFTRRKILDFSIFKLLARWHPMGQSFYFDERDLGGENFRPQFISFFNSRNMYYCYPLLNTHQSSGHSLSSDTSRTIVICLPAGHSKEFMFLCEHFKKYLNFTVFDKWNAIDQCVYFNETHPFEYLLKTSCSGHISHYVWENRIVCCTFEKKNMNSWWCHMPIFCVNSTKSFSHRKVSMKENCVPK